MKRRRTISHADVIKIGRVLEERLKLLGDGFVAYLDGWSDLRIGTDFGYSQQAIGNLRMELYGRLRAHRGSASFDVEERISDLEARIVQLTTIINSQASELHALQILHGRLCDTLAINRIADVKHLRGEQLNLQQPTHG